ncbi:SET domain-containing protein [Mollisia scopiformis]|uniref:SET domain-containing protein n=1 Tax=Mollisia scopiformis TaxID=149040 RepID=A0A194XF03_MOLSC|nr:SET domain-containing protein [Mollisia scopiformis]KUJ18770.1 SET domain-containing protein [Mollisia scopiformis]
MIANFMMPSISLASDFEEWMAGCALSFGGKRHSGEPIPNREFLPGNAWKLFEQEPRPTPAPESPISLRQPFINQLTPPKGDFSSGSSTPSGSPRARSSSGSSYNSQYPIPPAKADPLFVTEFFEVCKSPKGGYGAFATKDIEVGTVIMSEEPAFRATFGEVFYMYEGLTTEQRVEYRSLHGWSALAHNRILSIFKTNRFELSGTRCGIFLKSSRFNHACHPHATCTYKWNEELGQMVFTSINPMKAGDEITIQYCANPAKLYDNYGFYCDCPSCPDPTKTAAQDRKRRLGW